MTDNSTKPGGKGASATPAHRKQKPLVLVLLCVPFLLALYLIFGMDGSTEPQTVGGINVELPDGQVQAIEANKQKAMDQEQMNEKQSERMRTLAESTFSLTGDTVEQSARQVAPRNEIAMSRNTYRDMTHELNSFYSQPRTDPQIAALKKQVAELSAELEQKQKPSDPYAVMERSYALASKYLGGQSQAPTESPAPDTKRKGATVHRTKDKTVSGLSQDVSDSAFMSAYGQVRNYGFNTAVGAAVAENRNALRACIDADQTITSGAVVRLRLLEPMQVAQFILPANSVIFGVAGIEGQRMSIKVSSIESGGNIIPVQLTAHDLDGQPGLNVPSSMERDAAKNAAASVGSSFGSSISIARDAGQQVAMDLVRGAMTGGTQYLSAKLHEVKINLKAGYELLLISKED